MIYMTRNSFMKEEIMRQVVEAYNNGKKISVEKGHYCTDYQKINDTTCMVMSYAFGKCDYKYAEPLSIERIISIFNSENIKYGYVIYIGSGYLGNENMSVEQELHLKNEYLSK